MTFLIDSLKEVRELWTAFSGEESKMVNHIASQYAPTETKLFQMVAAYCFIATKRDPETLTASVSDSEIAKAIPKFKRATGHEGSISRDGYRKGIKPLLKECGLLAFNTEPGNRESTIYTFPALESRLQEMKSDLERCGKTVQELSAPMKGVDSGCYPHPCGEAVQELSAPMRTKDESKIPTVWTSLEETFPLQEEEGNSKELLSMENGRDSIPVDSNWKRATRSEICPRCNSTEILENQVSGWKYRCKKCGYENYTDAWYQ